MVFSWKLPASFTIMAWTATKVIKGLKSTNDDHCQKPGPCDRWIGLPQVLRRSHAGLASYQITFEADWNAFNAHVGVGCE